MLRNFEEASRHTDQGEQILGGQLQILKTLEGMYLSASHSSNIVVMHGEVTGKRATLGQNHGSITMNDIFMVPYMENEQFTGREALLADLCIALSEEVPKQINHRVALHGLGGVGKTQLALKYVYSHKDIYKNVYWISAVSQAALLSGFQEIGKRSGCVPEDATLKPSDIAQTVLQWLNAQEKWLLVIDNLDDVSVVKGYLPNQSLFKHILITTRNKHCYQIPAEGLEVGDLDFNDAKQLLLTSSRVNDTIETQDEAAKIVKELGCLPLAIDQAAAYIREKSRNIFKFLPRYLKSREKLPSQSSRR